MDPQRAIVDELHAADLIKRVEALEEQMQAKNTPRQPEPKKDEPKADTTTAAHGHNVEVEVHLGPKAPEDTTKKDEPKPEPPQPKAVEHRDGHHEPKKPDKK